MNILHSSSLICSIKPKPDFDAVSEAQQPVVKKNQRLSVMYIKSGGVLLSGSCLRLQIAVFVVLVHDTHDGAGIMGFYSPSTRCTNEDEAQSRRPALSLFKEPRSNKQMLNTFNPSPV